MMNNLSPSHVSILATVEGPQGYITFLDDPAADRWDVCLWRDRPGCAENDRQIESIHHRTYRRRHAALKLARRLADHFSIELITID